MQGNDRGKKISVEREGVMTGEFPGGKGFGEGKGQLDLLFLDHGTIEGISDGSGEGDKVGRNSSEGNVSAAQAVGSWRSFVIMVVLG